METLSLVKITFSLLALLYSPTPTKATLIEDVCSHASDPDSCSSILRLDPRAESAPDLPELGKIIVDMEVAAVQGTRNLIDGMKRNRGYPVPVLGALDYCDERCLEVLTACEKATNDIAAIKFREAKFDFYKMGDTVQLCRSMMIDYRIEALSKNNDEAFLISYIGSVAMSLVEPTPSS